MENATVSTVPQDPPPPQEGQSQPGPPSSRFTPPAHQQWNAERVRLLRASHRLTQLTLADLLGMRPQTISVWECGRFGISRLSARALDYIAASLAGGDAISTAMAAG